MAGWRYAYRGAMPEEFLDGLTPTGSFGWRERAFARPSPVTGHLVVCENGVHAGFCDVGPSRSDDRDDITGELYAIYVDPDRIGTGLGRLLVGAARRRLTSSGHERAELWVEENNGRARSFYERDGWREADAKKETFGEAEIVEVRYVRDL